VTTTSTEGPFPGSTPVAKITSVQNIQEGLLVALVLRYEQDRDQFVILSKPTVDSSSARLAIAGLRNEGLVEEHIRGVIRLTELGYQKYKSAPLPYSYAV
jgi:hypothetical protein